MLDACFSFDGSLDARGFRSAALITALLGAALAFVFSYLLFGTWQLPFQPFTQRPDPLHQMIHVLFPLGASAPVFIKRLHDRNRSAMVFIFLLGLSVGYAIFNPGGSAGPSTTLAGFVAGNVALAPLMLLILWLVFECCFLEGARHASRRGEDSVPR